MKTKTSKILKIFMILVCVVIALCLVACSERTTEGTGGDKPIDDNNNNNNTPSLKMSQKEAFA
ncbi:MAG: hypothetical protein ACI4M8_03880, partial [Christensenellales bacterium]